VGYGYENAAEINAIQPYYASGSVRHPADTVFWIEPSSKDFAFISWIDDLRVLGDIATD